MSHRGGTSRAEHTIDNVELSNLDKKLYPDDGVTKGDVIEYYRAVTDVMLPHLAQRPLVLHRFPNGVGTKGFVQQDVGDHFRTGSRWRTCLAEAARTRCNTWCAPTPTLGYLVNQAAIELCNCPSTVDALEHPDPLVIDIDPPHGTAGSFRGLRVRTRATGLAERLAAE